ncbi:hypothetical protein CUMW_282420, partial [Citrus unshiu]
AYCHLQRCKQQQNLEAFEIIAKAGPRGLNSRHQKSQHKCRATTPMQRFNEVLNTAMLSHNSIVMNRILDYYKCFEKINQLVDVGGVESVGGNMFQKILNGDAILMKLMLRNWDDEHCLSLLKNCYEAIPGNGKIIIIDSTTMVFPEATPATREASR